MEDWLKNLWTRFRSKKSGLAILFVIVVLVALTLLSMISDIGFAEEVTKHRLFILKMVLIVGVVTVFIWYHVHLFREKSALNNTRISLETKVADLEQQKESAFRLMERYKGEAQEDILNKLKQLAIFSLKQAEWKNKGAKIVRFRVEETKSGNLLSTEVSVAENVTALINLSAQDHVMKGMRFIVQDPSDSQRYGIVVVKECSETGSTGSIIEMSNQAFWYDVVQTIESNEGKARIITASDNVILPDSRLKDMPSDSAKELLEWLQKMETVEL